MTPRYTQATPRSRAWASTERPSRWRPVLGALLMFAVILACGIEDIRW